MKYKKIQIPFIDLFFLRPCQHIDSASVLLLIWIEVLLEALPTLEVFLVNFLAGLLAPLCQGQTERTLKHESLQEKKIDFHNFTMQVKIAILVRQLLLKQYTFNSS
jgi:hypothetical protein